jgi:hypothetical protein
MTLKVCGEIISKLQAKSELGARLFLGGLAPRAVNKLIPSSVSVTFVQHANKAKLAHGRSIVPQM